MNGDSLSDAELIRQSLVTPDAFAGVYRKHRDSVYAFVVRRVGREDAADLTSTVFETALKSRHRYDFGQPNCLPWLYGIAHNVVGDRGRRLKRRERLASPSEVEPSEEEAALNRVMAVNVRGQLQDALARIDPRDIEPLLLHAVDGLTYSEVAVALGIPSGTVATRIARARVALREAIPELAQKTDRHEKTVPGPGDE